MCSQSRSKHPTLFCLFVGLFNDAVGSSDYISPNDLMIATNDLEKVWYETFVTQLQILSQNMSGGTEENQENHENNVSRPRFEPVISQIQVIRFAAGTNLLHGSVYNITLFHIAFKIF